jgi:hypothetical protein
MGSVGDDGGSAMSANSAGGQQHRCDHCGGVLGVYEPIVVVVENESARTTSLLAERELDARARATHELCYREHG